MNYATIMNAGLPPVVITVERGEFDLDPVAYHAGVCQTRLLIKAAESERDPIVKVDGKIVGLDFYVLLSVNDRVVFDSV